MNWDTISAELQKPLDAKHVRPPAPGKYGEYIEGWHVIAEANRIFGHGAWSYEVTTLVKTNQGVKESTHSVGYTAMVTVIVGDVSRQDIGHGQGHSRSEGDAHDSAVKEAVTDGLKRALRTFGYPFGLALYDKTKTNVVDADQVSRWNSRLEDAVSVNDLSAVWKEIPADIKPHCAATKDTMKDRLQEKAA